MLSIYFSLIQTKKFMRFYFISFFHFFVRPNKIAINILNILNIYLLLMLFDFSTFHWWFVFPFSSPVNHLSFCLRTVHCIVWVEEQSRKSIETIQETNVYSKTTQYNTFCHHIRSITKVSKERLSSWAGSRYHSGGENLNDNLWKVVWRMFQIYLIAILK